MSLEVFSAAHQRSEANIQTFKILARSERGPQILLAANLRNQVASSSGFDARYDICEPGPRYKEAALNEYETHLRRENAGHTSADKSNTSNQLCFNELSDKQS